MEGERLERKRVMKREGEKVGGKDSRFGWDRIPKSINIAQLVLFIDGVICHVI
jgi:hypothetical protein